MVKKISRTLICLVLLASSCTLPGGLKTDDSVPRFHITGGTTTGPLRIERVELTFENGFGETTVEQDGRLSAVAVIRFSGNGNFRAEWKADGRVIEVVNLIVTYGSALTLPMRQDTVIPTFSPGPHELMLNILQPAPGFSLPAIRYFVIMKKPSD